MPVVDVAVAVDVVVDGAVDVTVDVALDESALPHSNLIWSRVLPLDGPTLWQHTHTQTHTQT